MSSVTAKFEKGTQEPSAFLKEKKNKNKILGTVLGALVLTIMSLAMFL